MLKKSIVLMLATALFASCASKKREVYLSQWHTTKIRKGQSVIIKIDRKISDDDLFYLSPGAGLEVSRTIKTPNFTSVSFKQNSDFRGKGQVLIGALKYRYKR